MGATSLTDPTQGSHQTTYLHLAFNPHGGVLMAMTMGLSTTCCMWSRSPSAAEFIAMSQCQRTPGTLYLFLILRRLSLIVTVNNCRTIQPSHLIWSENLGWSLWCQILLWSAIAADANIARHHATATFSSSSTHGQWSQTLPGIVSTPPHTLPVAHHVFCRNYWSLCYS